MQQKCNKYSIVFHICKLLIGEDNGGIVLLNRLRLTRSSGIIFGGYKVPETTHNCFKLSQLRCVKEGSM